MKETGGDAAASANDKCNTDGDHDETNGSVR